MKSVIFDLDGTLIDSQTDLCASINYVREKLYGLPPLTAAFVTDRMNRPGLNLAREFYGVERYEPRAHAMFETHYARQCLRNAAPYPGVPEMLEALKSAGCDLFVATNAPTHTSSLMLRRHHLEEFFADIIGADRVRDPKPDPQMLRLATAQARHGEIWMAGDSPKDMQAARAAGVGSIFVTWGYTSALPGPSEATAVARTPGEIVGIVLDAI